MTREIDAASWSVSVLPLPRRMVRARAVGFVERHPFGIAESAAGKGQVCRWSNGAPELLSFEKFKHFSVASGSGDAIAGTFSNARTGASGAVVWRSERDGTTRSASLHDARFESTHALGVRGDRVFGIGVNKGKPSQRPPDCGLVWTLGGGLREIALAADVQVFDGDGTRLVGSIDGRAAYWPGEASGPIDFGEPGEIHALDGELQIGFVWAGLHPRAALWRGSAGTKVDLTPDGFDVSAARDGREGWQVGWVRPTGVDRHGNTAMNDRASLWRGKAESWIDLNALLPAETYNISDAHGIMIRGDELSIAGVAGCYVVDDPASNRPTHVPGTMHAVVWRARLVG